ncbi:hypothetical protein AB1Y20_002795 [Prymnesium parvum]|uniref:Uncharacterized protein n=1 Tax=Prymnesium parvum TaxID=97485 RepID=A0AB34J9M1_PRYPA
MAGGVRTLCLVAPWLLAQAVPARSTAVATESIVAHAMAATDFVEQGWPSIHVTSREASQRFGFLHCFVSPDVRERLSSEHGLNPTGGLAALENATSTLFRGLLESAGAAPVHTSEVLFMLYCRTPVLTWHVIGTYQKLIVRSSAMASCFGVRWDKILYFESSSGLPRHHTVRAKPKSVHAIGRPAGSQKERYDALGPFEERMLLPAVVVRLLDRIREDVHALRERDRTAHIEKERKQPHIQECAAADDGAVGQLDVASDAEVTTQSSNHPDLASSTAQQRRLTKDEL